MINEMDYGLKEMNEMDYSLKEERWNMDCEVGYVAMVEVRLSDDVTM